MFCLAMKILGQCRVNFESSPAIRETGPIRGCCRKCLGCPEVSCAHVQLSSSFERIEVRRNRGCPAALGLKIASLCFSHGAYRWAWLQIEDPQKLVFGFIYQVISRYICLSHSQICCGGSQDSEVVTFFLVEVVKS